MTKKEATIKAEQIAIRLNKYFNTNNWKIDVRLMAGSETDYCFDVVCGTLYISLLHQTEKYFCGLWYDKYKYATPTFWHDPQCYDTPEEAVIEQLIKASKFLLEIEIVVKGNYSILGLNEINFIRKHGKDNKAKGGIST